MSWYYEPWTSSDDVLDGLPHVVAPPEKYNIDGAVTVWNWTDDVLEGLPYPVIPPNKYNMDGVYTVWNWSDKVLNGLPYVVEAPAFGINNIYFGKIQPNDFQFFVQS